MAPATSWPRGSSSQSGRFRTRSGLHQVDRVGRVLQVEHPRPVPRPPRPGLARRRVEGEPDRLAPAVDRLDLRAAGVPVLDEAAVQRVEVRRTDEECAASPVLQVGVAAEGRLAAEGPEALAEDVEPRPVVGRQLGPARVDGVESARPGVAGPGGVDDERQPGREVGVLHLDDRGVPAVRYSKPLADARLDPAGPGRGHHQEVRRSKPPARSRSATASSARSRTSSSRRPPRRRRGSARSRPPPRQPRDPGSVGPRPTKSRPSRPGRPSRPATRRCPSAAGSSGSSTPSGDRSPTLGERPSATTKPRIRHAAEHAGPSAPPRRRAQRPGPHEGLVCPSSHPP